MKKRIKHSLVSVENRNLPSFPIYGKTIIELIGNSSVLIEYYLGVLDFSENIVKVQTKKGVVCISGRNLEIRNISKFQLVIAGEITDISFVGGGCP